MRIAADDPEAFIARAELGGPEARPGDVREWVEQWRPSTANLRPRTLVLYEYLLRRFLLPTFEQVPLAGWTR